MRREDHIGRTSRRTMFWLGERNAVPYAMLRQESVLDEELARRWGGPVLTMTADTLTTDAARDFAALLTEAVTLMGQWEAEAGQEVAP